MENKDNQMEVLKSIGSLAFKNTTFESSDYNNLVSSLIDDFIEKNPQGTVLKFKEHLLHLFKHSKHLPYCLWTEEDVLAILDLVNGYESLSK